jgi:aminoglycoside phosphotransferase (APT) family kinase protein
MNPKPSVGEEEAGVVLEHHFGKRPRRIERIHGGVSNHVFEAKVGKDEVIVRISNNPTKIQKFQKEQWAVRQARRAKVPAPQILEVGNSAIPFPYMISTRMSGEDASVCSNRIEVVRAMGRYAAKINAIRTSGFGSVFDWSRNQLSRNKRWKDFLDEELKVEGRLEMLKRERMLTPTELKRLAGAVKVMRGWRGRPSLTHGDLRLKNTLLDEKGRICAILDWENCTSNLAPYWELSIALHDLNIDEKEAFLEGYGMAVKDYAEVAKWVKVLNLLNYAPTIEKAVKAKDRSKLESIRARLHGAFDLHSL